MELELKRAGRPDRDLLFRLQGAGMAAARACFQTHSGV